MTLIEDGLRSNLIRFNEARTRIYYIPPQKSYSYTDPEELVRAEAYLQLVFNYGYNPKRINLEVTVPRRTPSDSADIVVFNDDAHKEPYIVVECKKPESTDAEFTQAIEQGFGNTNSLRAHYLWVTTGTVSEYYNVKGFPPRERQSNKIADLPKAGRTEVSRAKYYKGGENEMGDPAFDIQVVSQKTLENIFKQAHDALWSGGKRPPNEAFDELDKLIFCKIWDEKKARPRGTPYDFQVFTKQSAAELQKRINGIYEEGRKRSPEVFTESIRLTPEELQRVVGYLAPINLNQTDLDTKGFAFETFMGSFFRGEFGQYFTPRPVVKFIIDSLPITADSLVLDPACGSGGFLLFTLDKIRRQADELRQSGAFHNDTEHWRYWHDFAQHNLFGIEISEMIARTAKMNMILHDDGHTNVIAHDGLENIELIRNFALRNKSEDFHRFASDQFDVIPTNPPFGSTIKESEKRYIEDYELGMKGFDWIFTYLRSVGEPTARATQKSEILYLEQCYNFLKVGGFIGMVVPDGILTNSSLQYVRDWIEDHFRLVAVISLPQTTFTATGAGVKSSVLFLRKYDLATVAVIQETKEQIQSRLFKQPEFGPHIKRLEDEKKRLLRKGDAYMQQLEAELVGHLQALDSQGTLDSASKRSAERTTREQIKEYQKSAAYREWVTTLTNEWNEKIEAVKEALQEAFTDTLRVELPDYPIFMAIAEEIGYDATGRPTTRNELEEIAPQVLEFIQAIQREQDHFFVSAPA